MAKFPMPRFICVGDGGWEIHIDNGVLAIPRECPSETRKLARNYIKGLKRLWASAASKGAFETMGEQIHGNTNTQETKYNKLCAESSTDMIILIGAGSKFHIESYVDGSYTVGVVTWEGA